MPMVYNGCGTWYYGKSKVTTTQGVCPFCHRSAVLTSYDTRLFVVVIFIPIIPLGAKHIIDQCSSCRRHRVAPRQDWERAQSRGNETVSAYLKAPNKPELAIDAIKTCISLRNFDMFKPVADQVEQNLPAHVDAMNGVAFAYGLFNRRADAERVLRASLERNDNDETAEQLAQVLIDQGRPADAAPYLEHIVTQNIPDRVGALYQLAQAYQLKGQHEEALAVFDQCETVNPHIATDKVFNKLKTASLKRRGTTKPVLPGKLAQKEKSTANTRKFVKVAAILALLLGVGYAGLSLFEGMHEKVYLVSGMQKPYTVQINGDSYTLQPWSQVTAHLRDGNNHLHFVDPPLPMSDQDFEIHIPFISRPFSSTAVVVNPDLSAAIAKEIHDYAPSNVFSGQGGNTDVNFSLGHLVQTYESVDYPFQEVPRSIQADSNSTNIEKTALAMGDRHEMSTAQYLDALVSNNKVSADDENTALRSRLHLDPDDVTTLALLGSNLTPAQLVPVVKEGLTKRPLLLEWHRAYQGAMEDTGQSEAAQREYTALLAADPNNPELAYLLSRVTNDPPAALALLKQATTAADPSAYAFYSLGGFDLETGQFQDSVSNLESAIRLYPQSEEFPALLDEAHLANGQIDPVLQLATTKARGGLIARIPALQMQLTCYAMLNQRYNAEKVCDQWAAEARNAKIQGADTFATELRSQVAYMFGDPSGLSSGVNNSTEPENRFSADLSANQLTKAEQDLAQVKRQVNGTAYLELYLAAVIADNNTLAQRALHKAIDLLSSGSPTEREYAAMLRGDSHLPIETLLQLRCTVPEKLVLLTAIGCSQPAQRDITFSLARKLNYSPRFPHLLVRRALDHSGN